LTSKLSDTQFTEFELDVLRMIVGNMSTSEIAFALDVEQPVVIKTSESIFCKLGVGDSKSATEIAVKLKLVKLEL
jgi:DNA-binding NarL/FixJ family response regulator